MALWNGLGQVATVAQLSGVDACGLTTMILEAVRTVSRNREECRHLARRVMMIGDLVQKLQGWDMMQEPEIRRPLDGLDDTLREAYVLIVSCQNCSIAYRLFMGWKQAEQFSEVQKKIDSYIQLYPFISHIDITRRLDKLCSGANPSCSQIQGAGTTLETSASLSNPEARTQVDGSRFEHTESQTNRTAAQPYLGEENEQSGYREHNDMRSVRNKKFMWCCWWIQDITRSPYIPKFIDHQGIGFPVFRLSELKAATNNFSSENLIGCGGFGKVYKGKLRGRMVAIKRCFSAGSSSDRKGLLLQFESEIKTLLGLHHKNIVNLKVYCIERGERILVYEYVPNGGLGKFIFGAGTGILLNWPMRFHIIMGIAQGIVYLHEYCDYTILHRDLKPSNVLLDSDMNPKITDFGLATILGSSMNEDGIIGTIGYMDPEDIMVGRFSRSSKSDVYSFGVILFEIVSAKRFSSPFHEDPSCAGSLDYAWELWKAGRSLDLVDPAQRDESRIAEILRCIQIALLCVEPRKEDRPTMRDVILMLSCDSLTIPSPKRVKRL